MDTPELWRQALPELVAHNWSAARDLSERSVAADPFSISALHTLGLAMWGEGDVSGALNVLEQAVALDPNDVPLLSDLAVLRYESENWQAAVELFQKCLTFEPDNVTAQRGLAEAFLQIGDYREARGHLEKCLKCVPHDASALRSLAACLASDDCLAEAAAAAEHSLALDSTSVRGLLLQAGIARKQKRFDRCLEYTEAAARLRPDSFKILALLAMAYWEAGDLESATAARQRALHLPPSNRNLHSGLTWLSLHDPAQTAASLFKIHRHTASVWRPAVTNVTPVSNIRQSERRLRVGYLSGEFVSNPAYLFLIPWLARHDANQVETFYYMSRSRHDGHTSHYCEIADHWRDVAHLSDVALHDRIRQDEVDVLVDLSGHFEDNRLPVFSLHPAPVQVTFPNYPGTTGVDDIDYILTDEWTTPIGSEHEYAETPYRLPCGYLVYQPPREDVVTPLPALSNGFVTFGLFQRPGKLHAAIWDAIADAMRQVHDSRLLVHFASASLDLEGTRQRESIMGQLAERGIDGSRVSFQGLRFGPEHFDVVGAVDIAFDTFPYNGQTTTCDCLWMGVPIVTIEGSSHVSRVTPAILRRINRSDWIASSETEYVKMAVALATELNALASTRAGLRATVQSSSLLDGSRLAREVESAYRWMWRRWCST